MTFTAAQWVALSPVIATAATSVLVLLAIAVRRDHWWNATFCVIGLNAALATVVAASYVVPQAVTPLLSVDGYALFWSALVLVLTLATATLSHAYLEGHSGPKEEHYVLLSIAALGAVVMAAAGHFGAFFIGLELLSVPLYGLAAYFWRDPRGLEAGVKYLILSAAGSAMVLFGIALIYAQSGTLHFAELGARLAADPAGTGTPWLVAGAAFLLAGIAFKLSLVPFHLWTPDVYEGAPTPVTAFLATVGKTAVFVALLRFFIEAGAHRFDALLDALAALAIASMLIGNVLALMQPNLKRLLGYSSIAHIGYLMVALIAGGPLAVEAVGVFLVTYAVTTMGAFGVLSLVSSPRGDRDAESLYDVRGLFWRRPILTAILTAMLLSLAGIPVTAGFIGKFYVLAAGVEAREWWLVGALLLGSAIGLYYYLRAMVTLYLRDPEQPPFTAPRDWAQQVGGVMVLGMAVLMLVLGLWPDPVIDLIRVAGLAGP